VVHVVDGDTITVLEKNREYKIRPHGINTPEKTQDFGVKAKAFTSDIVSQKEVTVIQKDVDQYGRVVGLVYIGIPASTKGLSKQVLHGFISIIAKNLFALIG